MAWTTFPTLTDGQVLTGAHMQLVRDNFNETAPGKATAAGRLMVTTGSNAIAERVPAYNFVGTAETTASNTYVDLATVGPSVTATSGIRAIVAITSDIWLSTAGYAYASVAVSGASSIASVDARAITQRVTTGDASSGCRAGITNMQSTLTSGSNTWTVQYRTSTGTGRFSGREITVLPL
jgi:hypothetical protein